MGLRPARRKLTGWRRELSPVSDVRHVRGSTDRFGCVAADTAAASAATRICARAATRICARAATRAPVDGHYESRMIARRDGAIAHSPAPVDHPCNSTSGHGSRSRPRTYPPRYRTVSAFTPPEVLWSGSRRVTHDYRHEVRTESRARACRGGPRRGTALAATPHCGRPCHHVASARSAQSNMTTDPTKASASSAGGEEATLGVEFIAGKSQPRMVVRVRRWFANSVDPGVSVPRPRPPGG